MTLVEYLKPELMKRAKAKGLEEGLEKGIEKGFEKGTEKGIETGKKEKAMEIVKTMLLKGIDIEAIVEATRLSKEEIKKLLN